MANNKKTKTSTSSSSNKKNKKLAPAAATTTTEKPVSEQEKLEQVLEKNVSSPEPKKLSFEERVELAKSKFWAKALFSALLNKNIALMEDREVALESTIQWLTKRRK